MPGSWSGAATSSCTPRGLPAMEPPRSDPGSDCAPIHDRAIKARARRHLDRPCRRDDVGSCAAVGAPGDRFGLEFRSVAVPRASILAFETTRGEGDVYV